MAVNKKLALSSAAAKAIEEQKEREAKAKSGKEPKKKSFLKRLFKKGKK